MLKILEDEKQRMPLADLKEGQLFRYSTESRELYMALDEYSTRSRFEEYAYGYPAEFRLIVCLLNGSACLSSVENRVILLTADITNVEEV